MKQVFSNTMLAHVYAQQRQPSGRNSSGSMSFNCALAFSYRQPVVHMVLAPDGSKVWLLTSDKFSVTTSGHMSDYRQAIGKVLRFEVPDILTDMGRARTAKNPPKPEDHKTNLDYFSAEYDKLVKELARVPANSNRIRDINANDADPRYGNPEEAKYPTRAHAALASWQKHATKYTAVFELPAPVYPWQSDADVIIARRDHLLNDPKRAAKQEAGKLARERKAVREREKQQEQYRLERLELADKIEAWRNGADVYLNRYQSGGAIMRIKGDKVQTSMGAEAPLSDAITAIRMWSHLMSLDLPEGKPRYNPLDAARLRLGPHFTLDVIEHDGTTRAGCHIFMREELERFAALTKDMK